MSIVALRVVRSGLPRALYLEMARLTTRRLPGAALTAIANAVGTVTGADPDCGSLTIALNAARDQLILAAGATCGCRKPCQWR